MTTVNNKPRLARLTAILTRLQANRITTARELAEMYGVSIRTIYRDIRTLEESGIPILTEEGKGYSLLPGYTLPPVMFSEEEANALITAEQFINRNQDHSLVKYYNSAIIKIKAVLQGEARDKGELLAKRLQIRQYNSTQATSNFLIPIQKAITNLQVVRIIYQKPDGSYTDRQIEPFALFHTRENWVLIAHCKLREDFRYFRLNRIQQLYPTLQYFRPHQISLADFFTLQRQKQFTTPDTPLTVVANSFAHESNTITMEQVQLSPIKIVGIASRTSNLNGQAARDIGALWQRFGAESILGKITARVSDTAYCVYTDFEGDHSKPYMVVLGCEVKDFDNIPAGMVGVTIPAGPFQKYVGRGDIQQGVAVMKTWQQVWESNLDRAYTADFEVYSENIRDLTDAEFEVYVSLQS
ncbi:MAG: effector binding domain-containing protein [Bacteroidota bacterium]